MKKMRLHHSCLRLPFFVRLINLAVAGIFTITSAAYGMPVSGQCLAPKSIFETWEMKKAKLGGNEAGGRVEGFFDGNIWVKAGRCYFKFRVVGDTIEGQRYFDKTKVAGNAVREKLGAYFIVGRHKVGHSLSPQDETVEGRHFWIKVVKDNGKYRFVVLDLTTKGGTEVEWKGPEPIKLVTAVLLPPAGEGAASVKETPAVEPAPVLEPEVKKEIEWLSEKAGGNSMGGKIEGEFTGEVWVNAGSYYYKFWVEGGQIKGQRYVDKTTPANDTVIPRPLTMAGIPIARAFRVGSGKIGNDMGIAGDEKLSSEHFWVKIERVRNEPGKFKFIVADLKSGDGVIAEWPKVAPERLRFGLSPKVFDRRKLAQMAIRPGEIALSADEKVILLWGLLFNDLNVQQDVVQILERVSSAQIDELMYMAQNWADPFANMPQKLAMAITVPNAGLVARDKKEETERQLKTIETVGTAP